MKPLEHLMNKKTLAGLVLLVSSSVVGIPACGDECAAKYEAPANGAYISKGYSGSRAQSSSSPANDDGCPPGCSSSSDTCCYCPD